jgi:hypothetical protein
VNTDVGSQACQAQVLEVFINRIPWSQFAGGALVDVQPGLCISLWIGFSHTAIEDETTSRIVIMAKARRADGRPAVVLWSFACEARLHAV